MKPDLVIHHRAVLEVYGGDAGGVRRYVDARSYPRKQRFNDNQPDNSLRTRGDIQPH